MSQQIQISGGAKVRDLQDVIIGTSGVLSSLAFNVANGVPKLDSNGKILVAQLPNSVMEYKGTWNVSTNTPTLVNGTGNQGDVYLVEGAAVGGTAFNFGAGPITFFNGDQVIYSGSIWQRASGATGTVTSVAVTESGDSLNITGSPITTSGTINIGFNGTNLQYVNGAGNLTTFPTLITSIGLSMPSAFSVANSPLTANGTIAVTGAGYASQYIRGDGTLADFPSSGGGGSSVSYYLNGGTSQGTIGGTTYYEMSKTAVTSTGVDFPKTGDGFIVAFLTDANDPAQLNIPAGNWNYEIYASMSANGGTPQLYAELYKYDGTTFTLISTSSNEILYDGINLNLYTFAMTVPATTLALTDRLAIKLYATNSGGKTTTIHTQDSHLCQIITTFSTGITALNGLTAQVQYFQVGTSGTDFNISSTTATHTFNIPDASATARGLITTGTQTIAGIKTFTSGINVDYIGVTGDISMDGSFLLKQVAYGTLQSGYTNLSGQTNGLRVGLFGGYNALLNFSTSGSYTYTFPAASGTIALTSNLSSYVPYTGATGSVDLGTNSITLFNITSNNVLIVKNTGSVTGTNGFSSFSGNLANNGFTFAPNNSSYHRFITPTTGNFDYTFPNTSGTIALTSAIPANPVGGTGTTNYLPKFTGASTIGDSLLVDNGTNVYLGNVDGGGKALVVNGTGATSATIYFDSTTKTYGLYQTGTQSNFLTGNLGLGVTPSAWSDFKVLEFANGIYLGTYTGGGQTMYLGANNYFNGSDYIYKTSAYATRYQQVSGVHAWYTSTISGTAGNVASFNQSMALLTNGNLLIGTTTDSGYKLDVNGTGRFSSYINANYQAVAANGSINIESADPTLRFRVTGGTANKRIYEWRAIAAGGAYDYLQLRLWNDAQSSATELFAIASTGAATFSSSVTALKYIANAQATYSSLTYEETFKYSTSPAGIWFGNSFNSNNNVALQLRTSNDGTSVQALTITPTGNVGIGLTGPDGKLAIKGSTNNTVIEFDNGGATKAFMRSYDRTAGAYREYEMLANELLFSTGSSPTLRLTIASGGGATFTGSVTATSFFESSSIKGKDIIATNPLLALDIDVIKYTRKSDESKDIRYGYSAEQIHSLMPELTDKDVTAVKYLDVHTILIANLQKEIRELKAKINN